MRHRLRTLPASLVAVLFLLVFGGAGRHAVAETQSFSLAAQWNLITFQLIPDNPAPQAVFGSLAGFQSAWTYDSESGLWLRYVKPAGVTVQQTNDAMANVLLDLPAIQPGRAYWVQMAAAAPSWQVTGSIPLGAAMPSLNLRSGWNLIGIPVGATSITNAEPVSLLAVLSAAGFDYDALLTWESQSFRKMFRPQGDTNQLATNILAGLPPEAPFPTFDLQRDLGRGYWIHVLDPAILRPHLLATVRPDQDIEPLNNFPSKEDIHVSAGSSAPGARTIRPAREVSAAGEGPRTIETQDTIRFFPGEDIQSVAISNLGDGPGSGGGIMLWEARWEPATDVDTPEPWIRLFNNAGEPERRGNSGELLDPHTSLNGVTTLENDLVYLRLDRRHLGRGQHEGTLHLRTSVGDRQYRVVVEIPGLEGDFRGYAVIQSVNGRQNPVPDIDLAISFYEDPKVDGLLRGLIDSSQTLLWPVDVPLIGNRVRDEGNRFVLGGSFVMAPGDQNAEPFGLWDENDPAAGLDVDWLNDGKLDVRNPFPFPIQRTVSLDGTLTSANPLDGYILEGTYTELVHGMSRQPILLSGTFRLERRSAIPMATRRSTGADTGREPVVVRQSRHVPTTVVPPGGSRSLTTPVATEMEARAVEVGIIFSKPLPHAALRLRLQSPGPNPVELELYDGRAPRDRVSPSSLESVVFPSSRPFAGAGDAFIRSLGRTRTDPGSGQNWTLIVDNAGNETVGIESWNLRLEGQPVMDVVGVVRSGKDPVSGATVSVEGIPVSLGTTLSDASGRFVIRRVPLMPVNLAARQPGLMPADPQSPGLSAEQLQPFLGSGNLDLSEQETALVRRFNPITAAPTAAVGVSGFSDGTLDAPFVVEVLPADESLSASIEGGPTALPVGGTVSLFAVNADDTAVWDFGDGTGVTGRSVDHVYARPGVYLIALRHPPDETTPVDTLQVVVQPAPGNYPASPDALGGLAHGLPAETAGAAYGHHLSFVSLTGAGWLPVNKVPAGNYFRITHKVHPTGVFFPGGTNEFGAAYRAGMTVQQMYAASMDVDYAPNLIPQGRTLPFASDGFTRLPENEELRPEEKEEDFNYFLGDEWRLTLTFESESEYVSVIEGDSFHVVWGFPRTRSGPLDSPWVNLGELPQQAKDGVDFTFRSGGTDFHPHSGTTEIPATESPRVVRHLQMACSMGGNLVSGDFQIRTSATAYAPLRRLDADSNSVPSGPPPERLSRNLHFQLHLGTLNLP